MQIARFLIALLCVFLGGCLVGDASPRLIGTWTGSNINDTRPVMLTLGKDGKFALENVSSKVCSDEVDEIVNLSGYWTYNQNSTSGVILKIRESSTNACPIPYSTTIAYEEFFLMYQLIIYLDGPDIIETAIPLEKLS